MPTKGTTKQRGYGHDHKINKKRLLYNHEDGTPCDICGEPMYRDAENNPDKAPLEADHINGDKTQLAKRLLHRRCNRQIANNWIKHGQGWHEKYDPKTTTAPPAKTPTTNPPQEGRVIVW